VVQPSGRTTTVTGIDTFDGPLHEAHSGQSVTVLLADDLDISRGDLIAAADEPALVTQELHATVCWLAEDTLPTRTRVLVKSGSRTVRGMITGYSHQLDIDSLEVRPTVDALNLNEIGQIDLKLAEPLALDRYRDHRHSGAFLIIDEADGTTLAAGMVLDLAEMTFAP
jgi:sulfate adenylyltransferase subunit 1